MNEKEQQFERIYKETENFGRTQFVREIQMQINDNKKKDKEIERLKNGYCELKEKCNNGECDCTNEEYDGMVERNMKLSLEVERLNNIINELEKSWKEQQEYYRYRKDNRYRSFLSKNLDKLKELKESGNNE